jgi:hypothetical protein
MVRITNKKEQNLENWIIQALDSKSIQTRKDQHEHITIYTSVFGLKGNDDNNNLFWNEYKANKEATVELLKKYNLTLKKENEWILA